VQEFIAALKIAFVTDGGSQMGMGHVQQSTTLARELMRRAEICFLTQSDNIVVSQILSCGFNTFKLDDDNGVTGLLQEMQPSIVIIDKPDVEEAFARRLKDSMNVKLVIFNNLTAANRYADIVVRLYPVDLAGLWHENITFRDEKTNTLYFYGPKYLVLRKEFYELHNKGKSMSSRIERILLIFGGSDPLNLTSTVLDELLGLRDEYTIDVILGPHFGHLQAFNRVLAKHHDKNGSVNVHTNAKNVAEFMYSADLVIVSPGLSTFEALCVGTPVIVMPQSSRQRETYQAYMRLLAKDDVGKLESIIARAEFVDPHDERIARLDIGQGISELIDVIIGSP